MFNQLMTFCALIHRDLWIFSSQLKDRVINALIWVIITIWVMQYIMPEMGLAHFGAFMAISNIASSGFWEVTENVAKFIADLEGEKTISYYLTLPLSPNLVFIKIAITNAIQAMIICCIMFPMAVFVVGSDFNYAHVAWGKTLVLFVLAHLFYGFFSLYLCTVVTSMDKLSNLYMRYTFPMWFLGSYQFTWAAFYKTFPVLACINLLNPMTYCMEGLRDATLGTQGSLSFGVCSVALILFILFFGWFGIHSLKKRLDCA